MMQQYAGSIGTGVMSAVIAARQLHAGAVVATARGARVDFIVLLAIAVVVLLAALVAKRR